MNHYSHHIGDWMRDTAHLSMCEEGAYRRLVEQYYSREKPLPADLTACCRLARAQSKDERAAVQTVLAEFFTLEPDGYHQKRCDEEISTYLAKAERNREVGKLGGNPLKKAGYNEPGTLYAVSCSTREGVKVGITKYMSQRLVGLRSKLGAITVLGEWRVNDMGSAEKAVLSHFAEVVDGEWLMFPTEQHAQVVGELPAILADYIVQSNQPRRQVNNLPVTSPSHKPLANSQETALAPQAPPSTRGSRLPADWKLPGDWAAEAIQIRAEAGLPAIDVKLEGDRFADYWHAQAGKAGTKLDWRATWRNWVRSARAPLASVKPTDSGEAAKAWAEVRAANSRGQKPATWSYPKTEAALIAMGGFHTLRDKESKQLDWKQSEFEQHYRAAA